MKYLLVLLTIVLSLSSCFRTRVETEEDILKRKERDSLRSDSITKRRNTPDTAIATFKRANVCDNQMMVVFDRVKVLSGDEAAEYALRHKRFGNNLNVIVNKEVTLETLPLVENAPVYIFKKPGRELENIGTDSCEYVKTDCSVFRREENFLANRVIEIIILHRSIIYFKERELE
jgi:hypothetical protein